MEKDLLLNQLLIDYNQWVTSLTASVRQMEDDLMQLRRLKQQNPDMEQLFDFLIECTAGRQAFMSYLCQLCLKRIESLAAEKDPTLVAILWGAHPSLRQLIESNQMAVQEIRLNYAVLLTNRI
ncbi:hypothetical protein [Spirosoma horti]